MDHDTHRRGEAHASPEAAAETVKDPKIAKDRLTPKNVSAKDDPEDFSDPICVCEAEPYWQEIAERLEREARAPQ